MGVLRPPTLPTLRVLLIPSKEKNRTLGTLAKTLIPLLFKNIKHNMLFIPGLCGSVYVLNHGMLKDSNNHVTLP
jgi:hypothetical protein